MIVLDHKDILVAVIRRCDLDVVELYEVVGGSSVDGWTKQTRYLLPFDCRETVDARGDESFDVGWITSDSFNLLEL